MPLIVRNDPPPEALRAVKSGPGAHICVAIPARNEQERIAACLSALLNQSTNEAYSILVYANNCTDRTVEIVRAVAQEAPVDIHLFEHTPPAGSAPAALARRLSVNAAAELVGEAGVVMMTDADSIVDPQWIEENMSALRAGADLVCGMVAPDLQESATLPEYVLQRGVQEFMLEQSQTELECLLDPQKWNAWPRHRTESAASIACTVRAALDVGGVPVVEPGEDKAFVALVRRSGGRVRHAQSARVSTSCRLDGRARGGWADDLNERVRNPGSPCHVNLEPSIDHGRRTALRGAMRAQWPLIAPKKWAAALDLSEHAVREACAAASAFEEAWAELEAQSPRLARRRVEAGELGKEVGRGSRLLSRAKARAATRGDAAAFS